MEQHPQTSRKDEELVERRYNNRNCWRTVVCPTRRTQSNSTMSMSKPKNQGNTMEKCDFRICDTRIIRNKHILCHLLLETTRISK